MAFSAIAASDVDADSPITDTLMNVIRTNFDDHETRIKAASEAGAVTIRVVSTYTVGTYGVWTKQAEFMVWCPAGITKLKCRFRGLGWGTDYLRLYIQASSTAGPDSAGFSAAWADVDIEISPAAGDKGAWMLVELQRKSAGSGGSPVAHKDFETIGGVQRDYGVASYWE
jgi:hypothetical protein